MTAVQQKNAASSQEEEAWLVWAGRAAVDEGHRWLMVTRLPALEGGDDAFGALIRKVTPPDGGLFISAAVF